VSRHKTLWALFFNEMFNAIKRNVEKCQINSVASADTKNRRFSVACRGELQMFFIGLNHSNGQIEKKDKN
jgi:hypothetical protein